MKPSSLTEEELLKSIRGHLNRSGFRYIRFDLPFFDYRISVYGCCKKTKKAVAVVLCIDDWQFAKGKAELFQACADVVYFACPHRLAASLDRSDFQASGLGLLSIRSSTWCEILVEARSGDPHSKLKNEYFNLLTGVEIPNEDVPVECAPNSWEHVAEEFEKEAKKVERSRRRIVRKSKGEKV